MAGAGSVHEEILAPRPDADLAVYAVWLPQFPGDDRSDWEPGLLDDPRVTHLWDQESVTGVWLARHGYDQDRPVTWDVSLLYGPGARWEEALPEAVDYGGPVLARIPELKRALAALAAANTPPP